MIEAGEHGAVVQSSVAHAASLAFKRRTAKIPAEVAFEAESTKAYPLVEFLRSLASLSVILWHYQLYFFTALPVHGEELRERLPLAGLLSVFYHRGFFAVQCFWVLSGLIFFSNYRDLVEQARISAGKFFLRRIARLYPLHLLTLFYTASLFYLYYFLFGDRFPCYSSDISLQRFASHLLMASNWFTSEHTFNAPIWSVSIEVLVYALFFMATKHLPLRGVKKSLLVLAFGIGFGIVLALEKQHIEYSWFDFQPAAWLAECLVCFYLGGVVFDIHAAMSTREARARIAAVAVMLLTAGFASWLLPLRFAAIVLSATSIFTLVEIGSWGVWRVLVRASWIGNLTYGSYLLHFPLALSIVIFMKVLGISPDIAFSPLFLSAYLTAVFALAALSYRYFESPARRVVRNWGTRFGAGQGK